MTAHMVTQNYKQKGVAVFGFEVEILIMYAFVALAVVLALMSLLLPYLVFRICKETIQINKQLEGLLDTLSRTEF